MPPWGILTKIRLSLPHPLNKCIRCLHTSVTNLSLDGNPGPNLDMVLGLLSCQEATHRYDDESVWRASRSLAEKEVQRLSDENDTEEEPLSLAEAFISAQTTFHSSTQTNAATSRTKKHREFHTVAGPQGLHINFPFHLDSVTTSRRRSRSPQLRTGVRQMSTTPYSVLGLARGASKAEIKSKYYDMVKKLHPDRYVQSGVSKEHLEKFHRVVRAYELLSNPSRKKMYDHLGVGWDTPGRAPMRNSRFYRPRTADEWDAWNSWSDVLRRTASQGPRSPHWDDFPQGFRRPTPEEQKRRAAEKMPVNRRYFAVIFFMAWVFGWYQFERIRNRNEKYNKEHLRSSNEIAKQLTLVHEMARSNEGRLRQSALLERAKKQKTTTE